MDVPQAVLQWDRGALEIECDRSTSVQQGVEAYLGRPVFSPDGELLVRVRVSRVVEAGASRVVAHVTQEDGTGKVWGERTVSGDDSCMSLDEPLTLVVALMVDVTNQPPSVPPDAATASEPEPDPSSPLPPADIADDLHEIQTAPSLAQVSSAPGHRAFLAFGVLSLGALPQAAVGARALASFKPRHLPGLGVDATLLAPQHVRLGAGRIDLSLLSLSGSVCPLQGVDGQAWYSACGSFGVARLHVESSDLLDARSRTQWLLLPGLGVRAAWVAGGRWMLGGGLDAAFPWQADRYVYRDAEGVRRTALELSPLVLTVGVGAGLLLD